MVFVSPSSQWQPVPSGRQQQRDWRQAAQPRLGHYVSPVRIQRHELTIRTVCLIYNSHPLRSTRHLEVSSRNLHSDYCTTEARKPLGVRGNFQRVYALALSQYTIAVACALRHNARSTRCNHDRLVGSSYSCKPGIYFCGDPGTPEREDIPIPGILGFSYQGPGPVSRLSTPRKLHCCVLTRTQCESATTGRRSLHIRR